MSARIAVSVTRAWVRLYTRGMPADLRDTRRAEIEADMWDHEWDSEEVCIPRAVFATQLLLRTLLGVPDDLGWRFEAIRAQRSASLEGRIRKMALSPRQVRWMGMGGLIGGALWAGRYLVPAEPAATLTGYGHVALSVLLIVGLVGFYALSVRCERLCRLMRHPIRRSAARTRDALELRH